MSVSKATIFAVVGLALAVGGASIAQTQKKSTLLTSLSDGDVIRFAQGPATFTSPI